MGWGDFGHLILCAEMVLCEGFLAFDLMCLICNTIDLSVRAYLTTANLQSVPVIIVTVDFGVDALVKLAEETCFPWLLSNVVDVTVEQPLAEGLPSHIITWHGRKVSSTLLFGTQTVSVCLLLDDTFLDVSLVDSVRYVS